jgi:hypothetical protein
LKSPDTSKANDKVFYLHGRPGIALSAVFNTLFALFFLASAILRWNERLQGNIEFWWNVWWFYAVCCIGASLLAWEKWHQFFFVRLRIAADGIWYYRLGNTKHIAWDDIERIGSLTPHSKGKSVFGLVLREPADIASEKLAASKKILALHEFSLSSFVDEWFVSELRSEIKRQKPALPVQ